MVTGLYLGCYLGTQHKPMHRRDCRCGRVWHIPYMEVRGQALVLVLDFPLQTGDLCFD